MHHGQPSRRRPLPSSTARDRRLFRPQLSALEGRALLTTFVVTDTSGDPTDTGSLPYAIGQANNAGGPATITFAPSLAGQTVELTQSSGVAGYTYWGLAVTGDVSIDGSSAPGLTIARSEGAPAFGIFSVAPGATLAMDDVTVSNGQANDGGGVSNQGTAYLTDVTISNNSALYEGGGFRNRATAYLTDVTLAGNSGGYGGGMYNAGTANLTDVTIASNSSGNGGGLDNDGTASLTEVTISGNSGGNGGGLNNNSTAYLYDTIVAGNSSDIGGGVQAGADDLIGDPGRAGGLADGVNGNIVGTASGGVIPLSSIFVVDANGNPILADNGGPTETLALVPGSPAISAGSISVPGYSNVDRRGLPRGTSPYIGAYEEHADELLNNLATLIPGGASGDSPLVAPFNQVMTDYTNGNVTTFINDLNQVSDTTVDLLTTAGSRVSLSTDIALEEAIGDLKTELVGAPVVPMSVWNQIINDFTTFADDIPGGLTGGDALIAPFTEAAQALPKGDVTGAITALNQFSDVTVQGLVSPTSTVSLGTDIAMEEAIGDLKSILTGAPVVPMSVWNQIINDFTTFADDIPGGLKGNSPLIAPFEQAATDLPLGDLPDTFTALGSFLSTAANEAGTSLDSGALTALDSAVDDLEALLLGETGASVPSVSVSAPSATYDQSVTFIALVTNSDSSASAGTVQFSVNGMPVGEPVTVGDGGVAVSPSFNPLSLGTDIVSAVFTASNSLASVAATTTLPVGQAGAIISVTGVSTTYDGNAHAAGGSAVGVETPTPADLTGELKLVYSQDGGQTFTSTAPVNAGNYEAYYTFAGTTDYSAVTTPADSGTAVSIAKATSTTVVTINGGLFTYNGSAQTPATVTVTGAGGLSLTESASYANDVNAGTAAASYAYAGDANHYESYASQTFTIAKASSTTTTTGAGPFTYNGYAQVGGSGAVTGAGAITAAATLAYSANSNGTGTADQTDAGTYYVTASYAGDANHLASGGLPVAIVINKANAKFTVTPYTVTYDGAAHSASITSIVGVNGQTGATVGAVTLNTTHTNAGSYTADTWTFTGGANYNNIAATTITDTINQASPTITAVAGATVAIGTGTPLTASATLAGGVNIGGSIKFTLYSPSNTIVFTDSVAVSGNGAYSTSGGTTTGSAVPTAAGTYQWVAAYISDGNNKGTSTTQGATPETVVGTGVSTVGTTLYIVGGNTSDYASISPTGSKSDGTTGLQVSATLNNVWSSQTISKAFSAIVIAGLNGNDDFQIAASILLPVTITEGNGNNYIQTGGGNDVIAFGTGSNQVFGGGGNKTITDQDAAGTSAYFQLGTGNDVITMGAGNDQVALGGGNNTVTGGNGTDAVTTTGSGNNTIQLGNGNDYINTGNGNDVITLGSGNESIQTGGGNKTITALGGNNYVSAGDGNDTVMMGNGNDTVQLGGGADVVSLGNGNDYVSAGAGNDSVTVGNGTDTTQLGNGSNVILEG